MARYQCRKAAGQARMKNRRGVTPRDEVRAMEVQYSNDRAEERSVVEPEKKLPVEKSKGCLLYTSPSPRD